MMRVLFLVFLFMSSCAQKKDKPESTTKNSFNEEDQSIGNVWMDGDIIFHTSTSSQSKAIQIATKSKYSHVGIVFEQAGLWFVYEAVQPVKMTPLTEWIARGLGGEYSVKRLKNRSKFLNESVVIEMKRIGQKYIGKNYDLRFEWSDSKIYCSELVWKVYQQALGIELGQLEKFGDFDLSDPEVQKKVKERYDHAIPRDEMIITPDRIYQSNLLETVKNPI